MNLPFKVRKSAGVRVTPEAHRLIQSGNRARDAGDWRVAAAGYRRALAIDPALFHIWIQLGHSLKEAGDLDGAEQAYRDAQALAPEAAEPELHLGHLAKRRGQMALAGRHYMAAVKHDPQQIDAVTELHRLIQRTADLDQQQMLEVLRRGWDERAASKSPSLEASLAGLRSDLDRVLADLRSSGRRPDGEHLHTLTLASGALADLETDIAAASARSDGEQGPAFVFDVSDLISFYSHARLPTGIQRVQIEAIGHALRAHGTRARVCCFINGRDDWLEVPASVFLELTQLSLKSGGREDPAWVTALSRLHVMLALALSFELPNGAYLINLGTSWWMQNYFLFVREAKTKFNIRYIPFVHDFIPIITPEHCVKGLTQDFISWAVGVFDHADHFLVNSEATKRDLLRVAKTLGYDVSPAEVDVIRLDADFRKPDASPLPRKALGRWGLEDEPYVLMVSTIESRKNHVGAFEAWLELIRRHGVRRVPRLVCVGSKGWLNDLAYFRLDSSAALQDRVTMLSYLADDELGLLYRESLCTLYPSLYEGWGLPVTESLCYGKIPVVSDAASLPEAGGAFAVYFETGSAGRLANAVEQVTFDTRFRKEREAVIAREFRPRSWGEIAAEVYAHVLRRAELDGRAPSSARAPLARLGAYHPIARNEETRIWPGLGSGEIFRSGVEWHWPEQWGCWTRPGGGTLAIGLPAGHGPLRVYLWIRGVPAHPSDYRVDVEGRMVIKGTLGPDQRRWVWFDVDAATSVGRAGDDESGEVSVLKLRLAGTRPQEIEMNVGGVDVRTRVTVALQGFFICELTDAVARANFLEAVALEMLDDINAYRERAPDLDMRTALDDDAAEWIEVTRTSPVNRLGQELRTTLREAAS